MAPALELVLAGARWLGWRVGVVYGARFRTAFARLRERTGRDEVPLGRLLSALTPDLAFSCATLPPLVTECVREFQRKWADVLRIPVAAEHHHVRAEDIRDDMFVAWGAGATLVVPSREELYEPISFVRRHGITHWYSVPSLVSISHTAGTLTVDAMPSLRWSLFAGEQLTLEQAGQWAAAAPQSTVENLYGPTELTVTVTAYRLPRHRDDWPRTSNGTVPIGPIYPHLEHRISDDELLVRGPQRFDGYLDATDDHERFVGDVPSADAWYRTGDRVGVEDGDLVHLGRIDNQLKVHGQRVELGEIEATLRGLPAVSEAVVINAPGANGDPRLVAVYRGEAVPAAELRTRLRALLPAYMIPKRYVHVDRLPLNPNGKIDRGACRDLVNRSQPVLVG